MTDRLSRSALPIPTAAALWQDEPSLFETLQRRLGSYASNSQRALAADWSRWRKWCTARGRRPFPAAPTDLVEYVLDHSPPFERNAHGTLTLNLSSKSPGIRRVSTVSRWLASLSILHRLANCADPTKDEDVKAARRSVARGRLAQEQKAPLHWSDVQKALDTLGGDLRDLRAKALLTVAYSTLARRAELVALCVSDMTLAAEGEGTVTLRTKGGDLKERYLAPEACSALQAWLAATEINEGFIFRRLESHGGVGDRALNPAEVARIFKRVAVQLNLDPTRPVSRISAHSTRIGAAQDLTAAGAALPEIMVAGGWKSPQMPTHYSRKLDARHGAMRRMLKSERK
jgi:integrase/recombinase XerD